MATRSRPGDTHPRVQRFVKGILALFLLSLPWIGVSGCENMGSENQELLEELAAGQKQILERLDRIEKSQERVAAAAPKPPPQRPQVDFDKVHDIGIGSSPYRGPKDAAVTLVEFSDYQCPHSRNVQSLIDALLQEYPNELKHVFKNYPLSFHKRAEPTARACLAAGLQGKYWEMQALVFANPRALEDSDLKLYAAEIGLDVARFERDFDSQAVKARVTTDMREAQKAQVTGTPTLFLNGKRVRDRSPQAMKQEIEALREAAKKPE